MVHLPAVRDYPARRWAGPAAAAPRHDVAGFGATCTDPIAAHSIPSPAISLSCDSSRPSATLAVFGRLLEIDQRPKHDYVVPDAVRVMAALYEQILLFGDSITQASNEQDGFGFAAPLQQAYARRLDVVNRGFNGYNTEKALQVLPRFMPSPDQAKVRLMTVFFGANDACVEGGSNNQHVCLEQYMENLRTICSHETVQAHSPRLLIITPPPVNEYKMEPVDIAKGHNGLQRTAELTKMYANAARKVGEELRIPVLDLWTIFMTRAGWVAGEPLPGCRAVDRNALIEELMYDGLHLTPSAYKIVMEELMSLIASAYPDMVPDRLPFALPAWNDGDEWRKF